MLLFHFDYGKNHQNKSIGIDLYNFCRAFHGASFQNKNQVYIVYLSQKMLQTLKDIR